MRYRWFLGRTFITIVFLLFLLLTAQAGQVRTPPISIEGVIQNVTYSSIEVNGKYYDISHALILTTHGGRATSDMLTRGRTVEITIEDGVVTKVRVETGYINK